MLRAFVEKNIIQDIDEEVEKYEPRFKIDNPFNEEKITFR